jgi:hypothetical protein
VATEGGGLWELAFPEAAGIEVCCTRFIDDITFPEPDSRLSIVGKIAVAPLLGDVLEESQRAIGPGVRSS